MKTSVKYLKMLVNLLLGVAALLLLVFALPKVLMFFLPLVIGWLIAAMANPLVRLLERRVRIVRKHSSMLIIIAAIALVVLAIYFVISGLGGELLGLIDSFPDLYARIDVEFKQIGRELGGVYAGLPQGVQVVLDSLGEQVDTFMGEIIERIGRPTMTAAGNFAKNIPAYLMGIIFTILSAYFFIADRERIMKFFRDNTPETMLKTYQVIVSSFKQAVGGYFKAQFKIMSVVFAILLAGFLILRIRYAVLLAVIVSFLDFLPFFGTGTVLIPWALFNLLIRDYQLTVGLLVIYVVSQAVRQLIQPKIVGDTVGVSPIAALIYIFIGYRVKGVVGMILAIPVGVILDRLYQAGVFNGFLSNVKEIVSDINKFRKM